jgi:hypothetical protein
MGHLRDHPSLPKGNFMIRIIIKLCLLSICYSILFMIVSLVSAIDLILLTFKKNHTTFFDKFIDFISDRIEDFEEVLYD